MTQDELLERIRKAVGQERAEATTGNGFPEEQTRRHPASPVAVPPVPMTEAQAEELARQTRLLLEETRGRAFTEGVTAGRLQLMSEMITHPNQN